MGGDVFCVLRRALFDIFSYICHTEISNPSPEFFGGGIFVDYQLFTMKHTKKLYLVPCLHEIMLHVERGFDASLEDPFTDPDHGWATDCYYYDYNDKIIL